MIKSTWGGARQRCKDKNGGVIELQLLVSVLKSPVNCPDALAPLPDKQTLYVIEQLVLKTSVC